MTKQTKSLGGLADIQASPPPTPETTDQRVDQLERRLTQAETLLNDVMQQLDRPYRDQHLNGKPKQAKPKQANPVKPKQVKPQLAKPKRVNPPPLPPANRSPNASARRSCHHISKSGSRKALARCKVTHSRQGSLRYQQPESYLGNETSTQNRLSRDCKRCGSLRRDTRRSV